ncbi:MAG: hypothetical protein GX657_17545, partial [Chloroflexi bacterium]|nr:hypothetical protein [Chloroflexota bacterium]
MTAHTPNAGQSGHGHLASELMEARRLFETLLAQYRAGTLDAAAFEQARAPLAVPDGQGGYWTPDVDGRWLYYNGATWVAARPPLALTPPPPVLPIAAPATHGPPAMPAAAQPQPAIAQRQGPRRRSNTPSPQPGKKPARGRRGCRIALIVAAILLAAVLLIAVLLWNEVRSLPWGASVPGATAAPPVSTPAIIEAEPGAGIPAEVMATPAPLAKDSRPPATDPRVILEDDFGADLGRWPVESTERRSAYLSDGQYIIQMLQPGAAYWRTFGDVTTSAYVLTVDVIPLDEQPGLQGVVFLQSDAGRYVFDVDMAGGYRLLQQSDSASRELIPRTAHASINRDLVPNRLAVAIANGRITLFANGVRLATVDNAAGLVGRPGMYCAAAEGSAGHAAAFDNLKVYAPFDGPEPYSDEQMTLILDAGLPQSFALVQFEAGENDRVRHETWSYHDAAMSFLFEDGIYA